MKKLLALLLFPLLAAGCTKGEGVIEEMDGPDGVVLEAYMDLRVSDKQGHDLLDSVFQSPQSVDLSKVKIYFVKDGKEELFYRENLDASRGYFLITPEGTRFYHSLRIFFNIESNEKITTTILDWGDGHRDVFKTEFRRFGSANISMVQTKIWLNEELIWDQKKAGDKAPEYEITR